MEQLTGAAIGAVVILGYVLLVQAMGAAAILLSEFIVLRVRVLAELLRAEGSTENEARQPTTGEQAPEPIYQLGGAIRRW